MSLKHLTRLNAGGNAARPRWRLIGDDGYELEIYTAFDHFLDMQGYRGRSKKRYAEAVARFVDYLIECGVIGAPASPALISNAILNYPLFLRDGPRFDYAELPTLGRYAREIEFDGLSRASFAPTLAAVNRFLAFARDLALKRSQAATARGIEIDRGGLAEIFHAIDGVDEWTRQERDNFKKSAVMAAVVRIATKLERPRGLRTVVRGGTQKDLENKEFPLSRMGALLRAAKSHRDRAFWLLLAGGGLRYSEALGIRLGDVDARTGEVWVIDPENLRFGRSVEDHDRVRFKGRQMSRVYLFEPLASLFWSELQQYLRLEFIPTDAHDFLFQKLDSVGRGQPLVDASDTAVEQSFKKAVIAADIPGPSEAPDHVWTLHSLRHAYGVHMLNYLPVPGGPGLKLSEVQQLMGHASIESTKKYARHTQDMLAARLEVADRIVFGEIGGGFDALDNLPAFIANRLREVADRVEGRGTIPMRESAGA